MTLVEAATAGNRLDVLRALRDGLAARLEACTSDQNFAVMGRLLTEVLTQIEAVSGEPAKEATALDELAAKRRRRSPGSADAARGAHPAGKAKRG